MELPTIPSDIEQLKVNVTSLLAKINKLPLEKMSDDIIKAIADADQLLKDADSVVKSSGSLVGNVNAQVQPLTTSHPWHVGPSKLSLEGSESASGAKAGRTVVKS